jgi:membrane protein DedA with SNARE-associated domain
MFHLFPHLIGGAVGSMALLSLTIIVSSFFLEEVTIVVVGVLAADGVIGIPLALFSLYIGVILGDLGLYFLGWLASTHPWLASYVDHDFIAPLRAWLETRFTLTIFSARFIPISRIPTYTASGFFRSPFSAFANTVVAAGLIWVTLLFSASYWFGSATSQWFSPIRWSIACIFLLALFFIGRHNFIAYRAKRNALKESQALS